VVKACLSNGKTAVPRNVSLNITADVDINQTIIFNTKVEVWCTTVADATRVPQFLHDMPLHMAGVALMFVQGG
jgi:hypothetical protein